MRNYLRYGCRIVLLVWPYFLFIPVSSQVAFEETAPDKYRIVFTDKNLSPFSVDHPEEFLSLRAIERRIRQGIDIVNNDLPVSPAYIDSVSATGANILTVSKWFNSLTFETSDEKVLDLINNMPFVQNTTKSTAGQKYAASLKNADDRIIAGERQVLDYGLSFWQTDIHHGSVLHEKGYTGQGIQVAVIDNGFYGVDQLDAFSQLRANGRILGTRDFVNRNSDIYQENSHGMKVLSIMGGYLPGMLSGTAPDAEYWLLRSEDAYSEYMIEEDNWIAAAEFADSAGVDIINTSLGYSTFNDPLQDHEYADLDGNTTRISVAADLTASKGILVIISAGNQGQTDWKYISAPADADSVLAIGAINADGIIATFSSRGPASDGRIKPDVVAIGEGTYFAGPDGGLWQGNGTSLSAPVITGLSACLWQANREATAMEILEAIRQSAHIHATPDTLYGYGIPDFNLADILLDDENEIWEEADHISVFPNPFHDVIYLLLKNPLTSTLQMMMVDQSGRVVLQKNYTGYEGPQYFKITNELLSLPEGMYYLRITSDEFTETYKTIKY